tara:strand:+ start:144650 stop:145558 length:909 start_codon:yes stop_codon:yes gene_type:complete
VKDLPILQTNVSLKEYNWWKVGGEAQFFVEPESPEQVIDCLKWAEANGHAYTVLGDGSNCLISDQGISGLTISTKKLNGILREQEQDGQYLIECLAGTPKMQVMRLFLKKKLTPALFLSGLPGQVGGGIYMNAGVREKREPREFCQIVKSFKVVDEKTLSIKTYSHSDIEWSYRKTSGWGPGIIVSCELGWENTPDPEVPKMVVEANKLRKSKQPLEFPSGGSTFKNPSTEQSAGLLIDQAGLKGFKVGDAQVSEKHANFIINLGQATAKDVWSVIKHVKEMVLKTSGIELQTEVIRKGFTD